MALKGRHGVGLQREDGNMGSMAQDERHERFLREAEEEVSALERQVAAKRLELTKLEESLAAAKSRLAQQEGIDANRA